MASATGSLTKKMGPLPVWAWGLILGVGGYFLYERYRNSGSSSGSTTPTDQVLDPNAVDPNTGLTYGEEEDAALNGSSPSESGLSDSGGTTTTDQSGATGLDQFDQDIQSYLQAQSDFQGLQKLLTPAPEPVVGSSPPTTTPSVHYASTVFKDATKVQTTLKQAAGEIAKAVKAPNAIKESAKANALVKQALSASTPTKQKSLLAQAQAAAAKAKADAAGAKKKTSAPKVQSKSKEPKSKVKS